MLIAAYAGCGKSTAAQQLGSDVVDLPSMPYRWLLPYKDLGLCSAAELEQEKGALHHVGDPRFPQNYILDILRAEQSGKTVLFPTIISVINALAEQYGRTVYVVTPELELVEEYRQRYAARGNSGSFHHIFIDDWSDLLTDIRKTRGIHRYLGSGEYLTHLAAELMERKQTQSPPVSDGVLTELEQTIEKKGRDLALWVWGRSGTYACPIRNIDSPETRERLEAVGMAAYDRDLWCALSPAQTVRRYEREWPITVTWFEDKKPLLAAVRREKAGFMA